MIVERVAVRNYRAAQGAMLTLGPLTYLVGRNGSGKSTLLNALALFFRQNKADAADVSMGRQGAAIEIEVTFDKLGPEAATEFAKYVRNGTLTVTKRITFEAGRSEEAYHGVAPAYRPFAQIRALSGQPKIEAYRTLNRETQIGLPSVRSQTEVDAALEAWEAEHSDLLEPVEDDGRFFGYSNVGVGKLDKYIDFVLVPAVRDAATDSAEGKDSTLRLLVDAVVRHTGDVQRPVAELRRDVTERYGALLESPEMSLAGLQDRLNLSMSRYVPGAEVMLEWSRSELPKLPEPSVEARIADDGVAGPITTKGHGLQRAYVMAALQAFAESQRASDGAEAAGRGLLLAVEEPELFQHPGQARHIAEVFRTLTGQDETVQVLACTHSPLFVDVQGFDGIRLVRKVAADGGRETVIRQATLDEVADRLTAIHADGRQRTGAGLTPGLVGLLNPYVNEAFFSDYAILVEGEEDKALLEAALRVMPDAHRLEPWTVAVIPAGGKKNLDKLWLVLTLLGITTYLVFDSDGESGEPVDQVRHWNEALQRMVGVAAPAGEPDTTIGPDHAILCPNLTKLVKEEVGEEAWEMARDRVCRSLGIETRRGIEKNAVVASRMLTEFRTTDHPPRTLEAIAEAIVARATEVFTSAPAGEPNSAAAVPRAQGEQGRAG